MKYTNKLGLPIWDNPETDVFDIGEFNKGNKIVDDIVIDILKQNQTINSHLDTIAIEVQDINVVNFNDNKKYLLKNRQNINSLVNILNKKKR